ncbi:MAG: GntR family transcriptional regulator [Synergistaceae bacterium]|jgi:DNA-binding GntR family transcriptional regulator|nr:GntR family transcriptional regulator [Synergistaceae bacterium]
MGKYQIMREHVRNLLAQEIQAGKLLPKDKISELKVCEALGISRTPAREALLQLASEGVLEYTPRKGFRVKEFSPGEKMEVYAAIEVLDALAGKLAVEHADDRMIRSMNKYVDMIDIAIKYRNYPDYCALQKKFHDIYRDQCGNSVVRKLLSGLLEGFVPHTYSAGDEDKLFEVFKELNDDHRHIVSLFKKKDAEGLFNFLMKTHWSTRHSEMI